MVLDSCDEDGLVFRFSAPDHGLGLSTSGPLFRWAGASHWGFVLKTWGIATPGN